MCSKVFLLQWQPTQYSCLENPMDGGAWWTAVHGVSKSQTQLSNFTFTFHFHALEKEMAIHSSVLAWRILRMGEPGGLPTLGSQSRTRLKQLSSSSFAILVYKYFIGLLSDSGGNVCYKFKKWRKTYTE